MGEGERECAQGRNGNVSDRVRQRQTNRKWESSKPLGMEALAQFQVMLMPLLSHLDLYCCSLEVPQGLPNTAQGCCNSLWSLEIKSKDKSNGKFVSVLFYSIGSHSGAVENTVVSTLNRKHFLLGYFYCSIKKKVGGICS